MTHKLSEWKNQDADTTERGSVRRASGFVLKGNSETKLRSLFSIDKRLATMNHHGSQSPALGTSP